MGIASLFRRAPRVDGQYEEILAQLKEVNARVGEALRREAQLRSVVMRDIELEAQRPELEAIFRDSRSGHIAHVIRRATLHQEPFPYAVVDDVLPRELYWALIKGLPPVELFSDRPVNKQQLTVPLTGLAPAYTRRVWQFLTDVVVPELLMPALVDKFRGPLDAWIAPNWPDVPPSAIDLNTSDGRIIFRRRGYRIPPHRDPKWAFITGILYLARRDDSETWGTQLYTVDEDREASSVAPHWIDPARCRLAGEVAFKPNRLLVFLNSVGAHGAFIPEDAQPEHLERYIYQFRISPTAKAMTMLNAALPEDRRAMWAGKMADY